MKKIKCFLSVPILMALIMLAGMLSACAKAIPHVESEPKKLRSPTMVSITSMYEIKWRGDSRAQFHYLTINESWTKAFSGDLVILSLPELEGFTMPEDGIFNVSIYSAAIGYINSDKVTYTFPNETDKPEELKVLAAPVITSFDNGILKWEALAHASGYYVTINGNRVSTPDTQFDFSGYDEGRAIDVSIASIGNGYLYADSEDSVDLRLSADRKKVTLSKVAGLKIEGTTLSWNAVNGSVGYRAVDIYSKTVIHLETNSIDLAQLNLIDNIYAISDNPIIANGEPVKVDYLAGAGTINNPYQINNAFDFRAIDYYEIEFANKLKTAPDSVPYRYKVMQDIDYNMSAVNTSGSNFITLKAPLYGTVDGNNKQLSNIDVRYDGGYWAMFDFITTKGHVMNFVFDNVEIKNKMQNTTDHYTLGSDTALISYINEGMIENVYIREIKITVSGGSAAGVSVYNKGTGTVRNCQILVGKLFQEATGMKSQACYEMAGFVLENEGLVSANKIGGQLIIQGAVCTSDTDTPYNNIKCSGGFVAANRATGIVENNSAKFATILFTHANRDLGEFGGMVGFNAGKVVYSDLKEIRGLTIAGDIYNTNNGVSIKSECGKADPSAKEVKFSGLIVGNNMGTIESNQSATQQLLSVRAEG